MSGELRKLRKDRTAVTRLTAERDQEMAALRQRAEAGDEGAELTLVARERQQGRDRAGLERMERRITLLEAEERREADVGRAVELARLADDSLGRFDTLMTEGDGWLQAFVRKLFAEQSTLQGYGQEFFDLAQRLAPGIYADDFEKRAAGEALRTELEQRGAPLRAIGLYARSVFEGAGGYREPVLTWGGLLRQALDGVARAEAQREHFARLEAERAASRQEVGV